MIKDAYSEKVQHFLDALQQQHLNDAQNLLEQMSRLRGDAALTFYCSGLLLLALDTPAKALISLKKAVEHAQEDTCEEPLFYEYVEVLAIVCARLGRDSDALYYGKLSPSFARHPHFDHLLPTWLENFEKSLLSKQSLRMITDRWMQAGANEKALDCLIDLLSFDPNHAETWTELIRFLRTEQRYADIVSAFYALRDVRPLKSEEQALFAYALGHQARWQEAFDFLIPLTEQQNNDAILVHHLLYREAKEWFLAEKFPKPASLKCHPCKEKDDDKKTGTKANSSSPTLVKSVTLALMAKNWHGLHLPSLVASSFYPLASSAQRFLKVILVDMSSTPTLQHTLLQQQFSTILKGFVNGHPIDPQTFATILDHTGVDCLIDLDGPSSTAHELYTHFLNLAKPTMIAPLIDTIYGPEKDVSVDDNPFYILTDTFIHSDTTRPEKTITPQDSCSLFSHRKQDITKAKLPDFPLTIGLIISPCHLYEKGRLLTILQILDHKLPHLRLLIYTPKIGGIRAIDNLFPQNFFQRLQITYVQAHTSVLEFCRECHVILQASPTVTDCYAYAGLIQSIPVCHLAEPNVPQVMRSVLRAFQRPQWSFTDPQDLVALLALWQDNPSTFAKTRQELFEINVQQCKPQLSQESWIMPLIRDVERGLQHG